MPPLSLQATQDPAAAPVEAKSENGDEGVTLETDYMEETFLQPGEGARELNESERGRDGLPGWWEIDSKFFNLRVGPNYKKNGKKEPSLSSMFRQVSLDWYKCDSIVSPMGPLMDLPVPTVVSPHPDVPSLFILNICLPAIPPAIMRPPDDGPCFQVVFIAEMTQECADYLQNIDAAPPAFKLFADWCRSGCQKGSDHFGRFKIMGTVLNWDEIHLPGIMKRYNSKPCVCTNSGSTVRGKLPHPNESITYIDMNVNVFRWGLLARQGLNSLKSKAPEMKFNITMTIEAHNDEEMPERSLFTSSVQFIDPFDGVRRLTQPAVEWLRKEAKKQNRVFEKV
eukprot:m.30185 g.30185  ORF g.30185 m.30185 type:complete len:338 (-) comp4677_c0_seq1:156-1169(-)